MNAEIDTSIAELNGEVKAMQASGSHQQSASAASILLLSCVASWENIPAATSQGTQHWEFENDYT